MTSRSLFAGILWIFLTAEIGFPCSTTAVYDPKTMVAAADLILRVRAVEYSSPPPTLSSRMAVEFVPATKIDFLVEEIVKGKYEKPHIILPGYLNEQDEWNRKDQNPPYTSARPSADGTCFADSYRKGGLFLLVLRKWDASFGPRAGRSIDGYTLNWSALGPVNEQLRSADDRTGAREIAGSTMTPEGRTEPRHNSAKLWP
jgi:hypothetical protein